MIIIKAEQINKSYDDLHVLKDVSLEVKEGEIVSIIGKSGSGKSTLLHILGTLDNPDSGNLEIIGTSTKGMHKNTLAQFRNEHIGFIFQFHHLLPEFNAVENVFMPALIQGKSKDEASKRAKELLDYLGLAERFDHKPSQLSGGEQQRVAVARALMNKPKIVFADEPSGNLDLATSKELHNLIFKLRVDFNQTFVIVTHNPELSEMSDSCLTMLDGKLEL